MIDLKELEALLAKATPGEWHVSRDACHFDTASDIRSDERLIAQTVSGYPFIEHDAALIVSLHNAAPALLAELTERRAAAERDAARIAELEGFAAQTETAAREHYNEWLLTGCDSKDAIRFVDETASVARAALAGPSDE